MSCAIRCLQRLEIGARAGGLLQVTYEASALHATLRARNDIVTTIAMNNDDDEKGKGSKRVIDNITTNDGNAGLAHQLRLLTVARRQHYPNVEKRICKAAVR